MSYNALNIWHQWNESRIDGYRAIRELRRLGGEFAPHTAERTQIARYVRTIKQETR